MNDIHEMQENAIEPEDLENVVYNKLMNNTKKMHRLTFIFYKSFKSY